MKLTELLVDDSGVGELSLSEEINLLIGLWITLGFDKQLTLPQFVSFLEIMRQKSAPNDTMRDLIDSLAMKSKFVDQQRFLKNNPIGSIVCFKAETFNVVDSYGVVLNPGELSALGITPLSSGAVVSYPSPGFVEVSFDVGVSDEPINLAIPYTYLVAGSR